jgi:V/A-type H+/Na+-transporting ATPase subunit A
VLKAKDYLLRSKEAQEQINILGDDGVPVEYHVKFWKGEVVDFIISQQDAFDKIDQVTPIERQKFMLYLVLDITDHKEFNLNHSKRLHHGSKGYQTRCGR